MTEYNPPVENVPIFDASLFSSTNKTNEFLTRENADSLYLHYPFAQGTETFSQNIILAGTPNTNYIQYPDGSKQYSASAAQQFQPVFVNYTDYQTGTTGYSQGPKVKFNGTWGVNDYVILRVCQQGSYDNESGQWNGYVSTFGTLICRPNYMDSGTWAGQSNLQKYATNSGNNMGAVGKALYYSSVKNIGSIMDYLCIYGVDKSIQFQFKNLYTSNNGWSTTIQLEYLGRSYTGGTVVFSNGGGTNSTNNILQ